MNPIEVASIEDCRLAVQAASDVNVPLIAFTPPAFCVYAGVLFAKNLQDEMPNATLWVDCADNAARVQEAFAAGVKHVVFTGDTTIFVKLSEIAAQYENSVIRQDRPKTLCILVNETDKQSAAITWLEKPCC